MLYNLGINATSLASVVSDPDNPSFLVATTRTEQDVNMVLKFSRNDPIKQYIFSSGGLNEIDSCPHDAEKILSTYANDEWITAGIFRLREPAEGLMREIEMVTGLDSIIKIENVGDEEIKARWHPKEPSRLYTLKDDNVKVVDISEAGPSVVWSSAEDEELKLLDGRWSPHTSHQLLATVAGMGGHVVGWDMRKRTAAWSLEEPHASYQLPEAINSLDFNPNKPHALLTGGDDGFINFWDTRAGFRKKEKKWNFSDLGGASF